mgnify:CR=1 FL=1
MKTKHALIAVAAAVIAAACAIVFALFQTHILCIHEWIEATCDSPETCSICGETQGEPLDHRVDTWTVDADPTCSAEGRQHGECANCGKTMYEEIAKLKHTEGEWTITKEPVINADGTVTPGEETLACSVCEEAINTREYTIELTTGQTNALKTIRSQSQYSHFGYDFWVTHLVNNEKFSREDAIFAVDHCGLDWEEEAVKEYQEEIAGGSSQGMAREMMVFYGFTDAQIEYAMSQVEY